jgi:hypothetical protein
VRLEGLGQLKNSLTSSGFDPALPMESCFEVDDDYLILGYPTKL